MTNPVQTLLDKQNVSYRTSAKDYVVICLNPDHADRDPSMRIDQTTGMFHCLACGFKGNIFKHFGVVSNHTSIKVAKLKEKLADLKTQALGVDFPQDQHPWIKEFRGISIDTLKHFGAFYSHHEKYTDRIFFPITNVAKKNIAYVGRHTLSNGNPRYLNVPGGVVMPIFPEVFESRYRSAVLVEGLLDMLNLYDKGLHNVCCSFGTNTMHKDTALKLLPLKVQGIEKIWIMYDGDKAGSEAATSLKPLLEECGYQAEIIVLEDGTDPGDLNQEYVTSIKEYISETSI